MGTPFQNSMHFAHYNIVMIALPIHGDCLSRGVESLTAIVIASLQPRLGLKSPSFRTAPKTGFALTPSLFRG